MKLVITISLLCLFAFSAQEDYKSYIEKLDLNLEEVEYTTKDRYVNTVWVITSKKVPKNNKSMILQHGLLDGGWTWLVLGEKSLAYVLANQGYTLYLSYVRGTQFSKSHLDYNSANPISPYWDFSFQEMAEYDLPSLIELIKKRDRVQKVDYAGHSQGTLMFFLAYMNNPAYMEENIAHYVALATVPNINHASHILIKLCDDLHVFDIIPFNNIANFPTEVGKIITDFCAGIGEVMCDKLLALLLGDTGRIYFDDIKNTLFLYEPGGTSKQNMKHWLQIYDAKKLQKYDYGMIENLIKYGSINPPAYNLRNLNEYKIPSIITLSNADLLADPNDVKEFIANIKDQSVIDLWSLDNWSHVDYIWADDAYDELYPKIVEFLGKN